MQLGVCHKKDKETKAYKYLCFADTLKKRMFILCTIKWIWHTDALTRERRTEEK